MRRSLQLGLEFLHELEERLHVDRPDIVPGRYRVILEGPDVMCARRVHQYVQCRLGGPQLCGQGANSGLPREIRLERQAASFSRELECGLLAASARADIDRGAARHEPPRDHAPDPARPARNEGDLAFDVK